tara:strand:- start:2561 stop:3049 length:489 start_codon:yes stop_codon:yes gene_type:complete
MNKLFLICPDCYLENSIAQKYGENCFFLTALGTAFDLEEFEFMEEVNQFVIQENIKEIYIVNDFSCTFINNALKGKTDYLTKADDVLMSIVKANNEIENISEVKESALLLAKLNIKRLAFELTKSAFLGNKIEGQEIKLKGLKYDRINSKFNELNLESIISL